MIASDCVAENYASLTHYDEPKVMIEPEPIYICDLGGYVTISPIVCGNSLVFYWEVILDGSVFVLDNQHGQSLTIGPISVKDLDYRYRMVARDSNGMCVRTITSSIQLKEEISNYNFEEVYQRIQNNHGKLKSILTEAESNFPPQKEKSLDELYQQKLPIFVVQPSDCSIRPGDTHVLRCQLYRATNYVWYVNGNLIPDSNDCILQLANASKRDEGLYVCAARNGYGTTLSNAIDVNLLE